MTAIALAPSALIPAGVLCHALKLFNKVVEKRNTLPIFGNVALASGPSGVTLTGTDLDIALVASLPGALADDGLAVTMNQSLLYDLARKATCPDIGVSDNAGTAAIDMAGSTATLQTLPFTDWPHLPFTGEINADFQMLASDLLAALDATAFAISTEKTRYYLNGVYFHELEGNLKMVATDGHRLALHDAGPCPDGANGMPGVIIPHKTVKLLRALLQPVYEGRGKSQTRVTPDHVGITVNCTKIRFRFGNYEVVSKLIDGTFPDYRRVMPNPARFTRATMGANEFAAMVSKVASISSERGRAVKLEFDGGLVMASISNPDAGSISDMMTADVEGPALAIGLNARYVMDILAHFKGLPITFQMEDQGSPARITGAPRTTIVLMPMRI